MSLRFGPLEIGIILVIVLIIFGVGRLPQVSEAIGKGLASLRRGKSKDNSSQDSTVSKTKVITELSDEDEVKPSGGKTV